MVNLSTLYGDLKNLIKQNFYDKTEINSQLNDKIDTAGTGLTKNGTTLSADIGDSNNVSGSKLVACDDSRLSDSRTPTSHSHGDITNDGKIGSTPTKPLITTTGGKITVGSFGDSSGTFCQGDDYRLSNARTPTTHTHSDYNKTTYSQTVSGNTDGAYEIGKITVDGSDITVYGKDTNTTYSNATTDTAGLMSTDDKAKLNAIEAEANNYSHPLTHNSSMITDSNTYSNIGNTANTLDNILSNINTKLGSLSSIELIEVTTNKGTPSASTMNKLYLVAESSSATNDNYEIFITVRTGTSNNYSYAWEKIDTARIDLSSYLTTSNAQSTYLSKTDASSTYLAKADKFSGSYSDLSNKPSYSATVTSSTSNAVKIGSINISGSNVDIYAKDTVYSHPTYTQKSNGLYKITVDGTGHVSGTASVDAADLPTHYHSQYLSSHQDISGKINYTDVKDNLTSTDTDKPLSANQGKELKTLINSLGVEVIELDSTNISGSTNTPTFNITSANGGNILCFQNTTSTNYELLVAFVRINNGSSKSIVPMGGNQIFYGGSILLAIPIDDIYYGYILPYYIVDNLTTDNSKQVLSAKQGKVLQDSKVNISDIKDNLTSTDTDKPLSANQGKELKTLIDGKLDINQGTSNTGNFLKVNSSGNVACESVTIPSNTNQLTNGAGFITGVSWNQVTSKPTIDSTPANNANNLISSQAVYNALANKAGTSTATPNTSGNNGTNGLMSASDKTKLDGMTTTALTITYTDGTTETLNVYKS